jgi:uncharacterized protein (DUF1501 family)
MDGKSMRLSRRHFLIGSSSLFLLGNSNISLAKRIRKKNLVIIILKGGMDGLTAVPLNDDKYFKNSRPDIMVQNLKSISSDFSLHPKLKNFHDLWKKNKAAVVHATNIPYTGRSHFDGQNLMQSGGRIPYTIKTGWLGRGIELAGLEALSVSLPMPLLLRGAQNPDNYFPTKWTLPNDELINLIKSTYENETDIANTIERIRSRPISMVGREPRNKRAPELLAKVAGEQLSRLNGPRVAVFDVNGFDTHSAQGGSNGLLGDKLEQVDKIISKLEENLGEFFKDTLILTLTEFGRTLNQNGGNGTDHGYGSAILMAGGLIKTSQVYTDWPGLKKRNLFEGRDLNATIDSRSIYCSAISTCFDLDFELVKRKVFWNEKLDDYTSKLFQI